ncbi:MAG: hypothetical protein A3E40_03255 [Candidatus Levybacteria bacterium RIFCSPHIGHO2_12_FULL_37_9]|nr:MAG: hypothetical protein A3E40_03255 [Candidatus Levybacteria bacterium RIFCSPHIGHO2_12_FULL_37_9]
MPNLIYVVKSTRESFSKVEVWWARITPADAAVIRLEEPAAIPEPKAHAPKLEGKSWNIDGDTAAAHDAAPVVRVPR